MGRKRSFSDPHTSMAQKRRNFSVPGDIYDRDLLEHARLRLPNDNVQVVNVSLAQVFEIITQRLAAKGLDPKEVRPDMIFRDITYLSAFEFCDWLGLLEDPLFISPHILQRLIGLRDSTSTSTLGQRPLTIFYIRTFTLTVSQLKKVVQVLLPAKITFTNKIFEWERRTASVPEDTLVYLRYAGVSRATNALGRHIHDLRTTKGSSLMRILHVIMDMFPEVIANCLVQEVPRLETTMTPGHPSVDIREQMLICIIERGALNVSIGGSSSSIPELQSKSLFQSLGTRLISFGVRATQEAPVAFKQTICEYARKAVLQRYGALPKGVKDASGSEQWTRAIVDQATPKVLKNGRAILLILGHSPPTKAIKTSLGFWECDCESSRILLALTKQLTLWETELGVIQPNSVTDIVNEGFLPFVNLYPRGEKQGNNFESATDLLRTYLRTVRPLIVLSLGHEVADAGFRNFSAATSTGLPRRKYFSQVGHLSIGCYAKDAKYAGQDGYHFIQITSYHPGALSFGGVSQQSMQRIFNLTILKAWLAMSEALKYSEENLHDLDICQNIIHDVNSQLARTDFDKKLQDAKNDVLQTTDDLRWRDVDEMTASKTLRKSATLRINAPNSTQRSSKSNSRTSKALISKSISETIDKSSTIAPTHRITTEARHGSNTPDQPVTGVMVQRLTIVPTSSSTDTLPDSYYEGRQLMFKMSYCNGSSASSAAHGLQMKLPLQRGDLLWLLDQFLQADFPQGGTLSCADPSVFHSADSVWPRISRFCKQSVFSLHPHADYLHTVARRASEGTYTTMQAVVSLHAALKVLRTSVQKLSFVMLVNVTSREQRRYTTFIINASCTDGLRQN